MEASPDNFVETNAWITLFEELNQQCSNTIQRFFFPNQNSDLFFTFRFTMIGNNSKKGKILHLERI
jgi:hypothetical protein